MDSSKKPTGTLCAEAVDGWQKGSQERHDGDRPDVGTAGVRGPLLQQDKDAPSLLNGHVNGFSPSLWQWQQGKLWNGVTKERPLGGAGDRHHSRPGLTVLDRPSPSLELAGGDSPRPKVNGSVGEVLPELHPPMEPEDVLFPRLDAHGVLASDGGEEEASLACANWSAGEQDSRARRCNGLPQHQSRPGPSVVEGASCDNNSGVCSSVNFSEPPPHHSPTCDTHKGARPKLMPSSMSCSDSRLGRHSIPAQNPLSTDSGFSSHAASNGCGKSTSKRNHRQQSDGCGTNRCHSEDKLSSPGGGCSKRKQLRGWRKRGRQDNALVLPNGLAAVASVPGRDGEERRLGDLVAATDEAAPLQLQNSAVRNEPSPDGELGINGTAEERGGERGSLLRHEEEDVPELVDEGAVCDYDKLMADLSLSSQLEADLDSPEGQDLDCPQYYALGPAYRDESVGNSTLGANRDFFSGLHNGGGAQDSGCDRDALLWFGASRRRHRHPYNEGLLANVQNFFAQGDNGEDTGDFIDTDLPGKANLPFSSSTGSNSEEEGDVGNLCDPSGSPLLRTENNLSRESHSPKLGENQGASWQEDNGEGLRLPDNNCSSRRGENVFQGSGVQNCPSPKSDNVFLFEMCKNRPSPSSDKMSPSEEGNNFPSLEMDDSLFENSNNCPSLESDNVYFGSGGHNCPSPGSDNVYLCGDENLLPDSDHLDLASQSSESENEDFQPPLDLPLEGATAGEGASGDCAASVVCHHGNSYGGEASLFPRQSENALIACCCCHDDALDSSSSSSSVWLLDSLNPSDWRVNNLSASAWVPQPRPPPYQHGPGSNFQNDVSNTKQKNFNKFATPGCAQQTLHSEPSPEPTLEDGEEFRSQSSPEVELVSAVRVLPGAGVSEPVYEVVYCKGGEEGGDMWAAAQSSLSNLPAASCHGCKGEGGADVAYVGHAHYSTSPKHSEVEKVMRWNEFQAYVLQVKQIGTSACGPTAVLNILKALECPVDKDEVCNSIRTNLRLELAPIPLYLFSRARAGTTAEDLLEGVERLTRGRVKGRFFHFWPPREVKLLTWLSRWMKKDAVPIMTMNQQKRQGCPVPDAWHHQMAYGVSCRGVYLTNPLEVVEEELVMEQLTSDSVLLVRRQDVVSRFHETTNLGELLTCPDPRWRTMNVLGQVTNVLRESNMPHVPGYRAQLTSHVAIPAIYQAGVTLFMQADNPALQELLHAPDLPELPPSDSESNSDSDSS